MLGLGLLSAPVLRADDGSDSGTRNGPIKVTEQVGMDQNLGKEIPLDATFKDESGKDVRLADFFNKGPVVLGMVYYECPSLCTMVMNAAFRGLAGVKFKRGEEFSVIFVSIDPKETPELAEMKKVRYTKTFLHSDSESGFHFLTGTQAEITRLAKAIGFRYEYDPISKQYAHPGALTILTPQGVISRYLFGVDFPTKDLNLALVEASNGEIGSPLDHFMLYCYRYDPTVGKYGLAIMNILRIFGAVTVGAIGCLIFFLSRSHRRRRIDFNPDTP